MAKMKTRSGVAASRLKRGGEALPGERAEANAFAMREAFMRGAEKRRGVSARRQRRKPLSQPSKRKSSEETQHRRVLRRHRRA